MAEGKSRAIVSVVGKDRTGIIAGISTAISAMEGNILDISQTVLGDTVFTMVMLVEISHINTSFDEFREKLTEVGSGLGMETHVQLEEIFESMYRI